MPMRDPVNGVWPSPGIGPASELSCSRPFDEKSPRAWSRSPAATEISHGAWENGLRLTSAWSAPELPAANTTTTPLSATALVAMFVGLFGSYCWNELPHELFTTSMPHRSGWSSMLSYAEMTAVVNSTSPIE